MACQSLDASQLIESTAWHSALVSLHGVYHLRRPGYPTTDHQAKTSGSTITAPSAPGTASSASDQARPLLPTGRSRWFHRPDANSQSWRRCSQARLLYLILAREESVAAEFSDDTCNRNAPVAALVATTLSIRPARPALQVGGDSYTYRELRQRTIDYQRFARRNGILPADRVLYLGGAGLDLFACLLAGVLGSYTVSLGSGLLPPQARVNLVRRLNPRLIITELDSPSPPGGYRCASPGEVRAGAGADLDPAGAPHAYLSLTSGTSGHPTLALVDAHGLGGFCQWAIGETELGPADRWFEGSDPSADLAVTNALLTFSSGACLVVPAPRQRLRLATLAATHGATIMRVVPSVGSLMLAEAGRRRAPLPGLRVLAFGGDELPADLPARLLRGFHSSARTLNTYGMTESAGFLLYYWFDAGQLMADAGRAGRGSVPLGHPVPGVQAWIDDSSKCPATVDDLVDLDDMGELVVRARTVALEIETDTGPAAARKSRPGAEGELHTGDLVRKDGDNFVFCGRTDRVVKIHGVRVNLAQLDRLTSRLLGTSVCMIKHGNSLVALVESKRQISRDDAIRQAKDALHGPLVPEHLITVPSLPRTRSGKVSIGQCAEILRNEIR